MACGIPLRHRSRPKGCKPRPTVWANSSRATTLCRSIPQCHCCPRRNRAWRRHMTPSRSRSLHSARRRSSNSCRPTAVRNRAGLAPWSQSQKRDKRRPTRRPLRRLEPGAAGLAQLLPPAECLRQPSTTSTPTAGVVSSFGSATSTHGHHGSGSDDATYPGGRPTEDEVTLLKPNSVPVTRYQYRAARIPSPWSTALTDETAA